MSKKLKPLYYVEGKVIHKRAVCSGKTEKGTNWTIGFPVCTVSEYIAPEALCAFFNEAERPSATEPTDV